MEIEIFGHSDDCIEIEGDFREEFYLSNQELEKDLLVFSDGTVIEIKYTSEGFWKIMFIAKGEAKVVSHDLATDVDDNYSDRLKLSGDFKWVVHNNLFYPMKKGDRK